MNFNEEKLPTAARSPVDALSISSFKIFSSSFIFISSNFSIDIFKIS